MPFVGLILSLIILAGFWLSRVRLVGFAFLAWNRTPASQLLKAVGVGVVAALVVGWVFRDLRTGSLPALPEIWMGITFGPLAEELIFRGMLFHGLMLLLRRWLAKPDWIAMVIIAGAFAVSHLVKAGITPSQIAAIFLTGCLYGWLRLDSGSTAPPLLAHAAYNAVLFGIAFLR